MNPFGLRRFGAAMVLCLACLCWPSAPAAAADPSTEGLRHGSRANASDGTMVVYDKVDGIYLVPDRKDTYWTNAHFYQYENGVWLTSTAIAGPWELIPQHLVPDAARGRHAPPKAAVTAKLPSGREAVFEPRLGVYKVAGRKGVFLFDALFYRYDSGIWLESNNDDGPWTTTSMKILPQPLRRALPPPVQGQTVTLPSGETLVYDADARTFTLQDKPETIYFDGTFYEMRGNQWFASAKPAAGFEQVVTSEVPAPVRAKPRKPEVEGDKAKSDKKTKDEKKQTKADKLRAQKGGNKAGAAGKQGRNANKTAGTGADESNE